MHPKTSNIIAITETHLTPGHLDEEILSKFNDYILHRTDRDTEIGRKSKCGGVALLTTENLVSVKTDTYSNGCCELIKVDFDEISTTVIVIYRPPDTLKEEFNQILTKLNHHLTTNTYETILVAGDFNFPSSVVTWEQTDSGIVTVPTNILSDPTKLQFQDLLNIVDAHFLHQNVTGKTTSANTSKQSLNTMSNLQQIMNQTSQKYLSMISARPTRTQ